MESIQTQFFQHRGQTFVVRIEQSPSDMRWSASVRIQRPDATWFTFVDRHATYRSPKLARSSAYTLGERLIERAQLSR